MPRTPAGLHVPISREERMRAINSLHEKMEEDVDDPQAKILERELRLLDDRCRVVKISARAGELPPKARAAGVIPGRWHMKLLTHPVNAYFPITGPDWEYRDPDLHFAEEMKARDLQRSGALEEIEDAEDQRERDAIRAELLEGEQREDETAMAFRAAKRVRGDGGELRRTDLGNAPHVPYAGGVSFPKSSDSGLLLPAGA